MTSELHSTTGTDRNAYAVLDDLMALIGVDGLTAALAHPGLLAAVDQHAAAVREAVRGSGRRLGAPALAGYASAIMAGARRMGRSLPAPGEAAGVDWVRADWHLVRLIAVCALAEEGGWL